MTLPFPLGITRYAPQEMLFFISYYKFIAITNNNNNNDNDNDNDIDNDSDSDNNDDDDNDNIVSYIYKL